MVGEVYRFGWTSVSLSRCELAEGAVGVVVAGALVKDEPQVPLAGDQHPVQALAAAPVTRRSAIELDRIVKYTRSR